MRKGSEMDQIKKFSTKVRLRRLELRMSQEELAERVDCHVNHIGRIERAQADPSLSMMTKIARALGVPLKDLIT